MSIRLVTDSSGDLRSLPGIDIRCVPLVISTAERTFTDDENLDVAEMLDYLGTYRGRSFTACPSIEAWTEAYEGADEIYAFTLSSNLSGSYNMANVAAESYMEDHPGAKVHVFDSLSAGSEQQLLIRKVADLVRAGKSFEQICAEAREYQHYTRIIFGLENFHNLVENGRVSRVAAAAAGMLGIRIIATGSSKGTIETLDKCRGERRTLESFMNRMKNVGYSGGKVLIGHVLNQPMAETVRNAIMKLYANAEVMIYELGGLCSFYAEKGGILIGLECDMPMELLGD